jgi:hypothetical protein
MIRIGTISLWQRFANWSLGIALAILVNAYIVSGLATASLLFFRERLRTWLAKRQAGQSGSIAP